MSPRFWFRGVLFTACVLGRVGVASGAELKPAPQEFFQEIAHRFNQNDGLPNGPAQLLECSPNRATSAFVNGNWYAFGEGRWVAQKALTPIKDTEFAFYDGQGQENRVDVPWREVRQLLCNGAKSFLATPFKVFGIENG